MRDDTYRKLNSFADVTGTIKFWRINRNDGVSLGKVS
jgi:hypothetical protein